MFRWDMLGVQMVEWLKCGATYDVQCFQKWLIFLETEKSKTYKSVQSFTLVLDEEQNRWWNSLWARGMTIELALHEWRHRRFERSGIGALSKTFSPFLPRTGSYAADLQREKKRTWVISESGLEEMFAFACSIEWLPSFHCCIKYRH